LESIVDAGCFGDGVIEGIGVFMVVDYLENILIFTV
jgi:hypothetical protein